MFRHWEKIVCALCLAGLIATVPIMLGRKKALVSLENSTRLAMRELESMLDLMNPPDIDRQFAPGEIRESVAKSWRTGLRVPSFPSSVLGVPPKGEAGP